LARTKEQRAWDNFSGSIDRRRLRPLRVENLVGDGTPDVICINRQGSSFWIENKALDDWPKRASTHPLKVAFEPGQLPFAREWIEWGGHAFVLLRVAVHDWLLLDPFQPLPEMTKDELVAKSVRIGKDEIIKFLEVL
jgi:hypothetical protein